MDIAALLFSGVELFKQMINTPSTKGPVYSGENWSSGFKEEDK